MNYLLILIAVVRMCLAASCNSVRRV